MLSAHQEVERLLTQIRAKANDPAVDRASDQLEVICRAYMEPDQASEGYALGLSTSRARMFDLMLARRGQVVTRSALLDACLHQADAEPEIKIIDVHMTTIRKKLKGTQYQDKIETLYGVGYRLAA